MGRRSASAQISRIRLGVLTILWAMVIVLARPYPAHATAGDEPAAVPAASEQEVPTPLTEGDDESSQAVAEGGLEAPEPKNAQVVEVETPSEGTSGQSTETPETVSENVDGEGVAEAGQGLPEDSQQSIGGDDPEVGQGIPEDGRQPVAEGVGGEAAEGAPVDPTATEASVEPEETQLPEDAEEVVDLSAQEGDAATLIVGASDGTEGLAGDPEPPAVPAPPANAVSVKEGTYLFESGVSDEKVLDAAGKNPTANSNVISWTYNGGANQRWIVRKDAESSWYRIYSAVGGMKLALGLKPNAKNAYNVALVDPDEAGTSALWAFVRSSSWYNIVNCMAPTRYLEVANGSKENGANVQVAEKDASKWRQQRFYLIDTKVSVEGSQDVSEAAYKVSPTANNKVVTEVRGGKSTSGNNVWLYTANGREHQKLYFEPDGKGFYTIWVVGTGRVLGLDTSSIVPGNNVVQRYYSSDNPTRKWAVSKNGDGTYTIVNKGTGLALGAQGSSSRSNLVLTRNDGYKTTRFTFNRIQLLAAGIVEIHPYTSNKVLLDVRNAASSGTAGLVLWTDKNSLNQRFELVKASGTDIVRIRTASSGGWVTDIGSEVRQQGKGSNAATKANTWRVKYSNGGYSFVNVATGHALDMKGGSTNKGTPIIGYGPNGRNSQRYKVEYTSLLTSGCYFLRNGKGSYLDIEDDSPYEGARAQLRSKDGYLGQYFTVQQAGQYIRIKNTYSDRYLKVDGSSRVVQGGRSYSGAQVWKACIEDGGVVSIVSASTGKAIDGSNANATKAASVSHAKAQTWKAEKTSYHPFSGYVQRAVSNANDSWSGTGYLLVVDKSAHQVLAMTGGNGYWKPYRIMDCSVGAWDTPTVEGSFTVGSKGTSFGVGYTCWYWTQFYDDYLFHSVLYNPGSQSSIQDGRLGMHISHGCVRMDIGDAYWIYSTIPSGSRVLVYS